MPLPASRTSDLEHRIRSVLDQIRPAIQDDDGDVELVTADAEGRVVVRFLGACVGCPSSHVTLQMGIERHLRERIPEVTSVTAVEDAVPGGAGPSRAVTPLSRSAAEAAHVAQGRRPPS